MKRAISPTTFEDRDLYDIAKQLVDLGVHLQTSLHQSATPRAWACVGLVLPARHFMDVDFGGRRLLTRSTRRTARVRVPSTTRAPADYPIGPVSRGLNRRDFTSESRLICELMPDMGALAASTMSPPAPEA